MSNEGTEHKKDGCGGCFKKFAIGCLTVIVLLGVGGFLAGKSLRAYAQKLTAEYTEASPVVLPNVEITDAEKTALFQRVDAFAKAMKEGGAVPDLTLSAQDLNVLIQKNPSWSDMKNKVYVSIEGDRMTGEVSLPLGNVFKMLQGRWLNGKATFRVDTAAAGLLVFLEDMSVRGKPAPKVVQALHHVNLASKASENPKSAEVLQKLESVNVRDGKLVIKAKQR